MGLHKSRSDFKMAKKTAEFYDNFQVTEEVRALMNKFPDTERSLSRLIRLGPNPKRPFSLKTGMSLFFMLKEKDNFLSKTALSRKID